jgi:hypothetical protein
METNSQTPKEPTPPRWLIPLVNGLIKALLRSPLHRVLSSQVMLISFVGRKSGRRYTTPVSRIQNGRIFQVFTRTQWWKNMRGGAPVTLVVEGRSVSGYATTSDDPDTVFDGAQRFLAANGPASARRLGLALPPERMPEEDELRSALRSYALITITTE